MSAITFGSLFSGCGGMDSGLEDAGMRCAWQVEIEPSCNEVLGRHWPGVPRFRDIREVRVDELAPVQLIAAGVPCQDWSLAGARAGLDGERSGLFHEFIRIADSQPAAWVLFENVPGLLSSHDGIDFAVILRELTGFWPTVPADGWRSGGVCVGTKRWCVWRMLDSQYLGVPQRRLRLFLVGGPRNGACAPQVLLEPESLPGHPSPRREAGENAAGSLTSGASRRGGWRAGGDEAAAGQVIAALTARDGGPDDNRAQAGHLVAGTLTAQYSEQSGRDLGEMPGGIVPVVAHTLRGEEGFDASEDGTGRGTPIIPVGYGGNRTGGSRDIAASLSSHSGRYDFESETLLAYNVQSVYSEGNGPHASPTQISKVLDSHGLNPDCQQGGTVIAKPYHLAQITSAENRANPQPGDPAPALNGDPRLAVAFTCKRGGEDALEDLAPTLRAMNFDRSHMNGGGQVAVVAATLRATMGSGTSGHHWDGAVEACASGVRRLTPRETERLQSYPDDWTRWGASGKELSDSARYRMVGNGVTRSVAAWIGRRIAAALHPEPD